VSIREFDDGLARCAWLNNDPLYIEYHDTEWGVARHGDQEMFERIALEGFQAGLSWITILKRREGFRAAFHGFDLERVAAMNQDDVERLMLDPGIIRNRAKILSTIKNANTILEMRANGESISELVWSFAPPADRRVRPADGFEWVATTPESDALSIELRRRGFSFVGSTTMYALMQATGFVNDHAPGCFRREQLA
jgi:DNA-3-methyladenine glycosylase I